MRKVVADWSDNWDTVRELLRGLGYSSDEFPTLSISNIRQAIALNQKTLTMRMGGVAVTATSQIVEFENCNQPAVVHETVQRALDYIKLNPNCVGKTIAKEIDVTDEHFRSRIVPKLKELGVRNGRNGYYLP